MTIDPYLYAGLMHYLEDLKKRGDNTAARLLDSLKETTNA